MSYIPKKRSYITAVSATFRNRNALLLLWIFLLILCMAWNAYSILGSKSYIRGFDNNFYFAWARSIVLDGDLDFTNDLLLVAKNNDLGKTQNAFATYLEQTPKTSEGYLPNKYGIGMGLLALPSLYLVKTAIRVFKLFPNYNETELSRIYALIFVLNAIFLGFAGLLFSYILLKRHYGVRKALASVILGTGGLSVGYYIWYEPTMAHATSFGLVTIYLLVCTCWIKKLLDWQVKKNLRWLLLVSLLMGFALGVACTVRYTNVVFALVPFIFAIKAIRTTEQNRTVYWILVGVISFFAASLGSLAGFTPQLYSWKIVYGKWLLYSYQGEQIWAYPRYAFEILFGLRNSLFVWTPLAVVAIVGLVIGVAKKNSLAQAGLLVILCMVWIYGSWECYWLGHSYGMRGLVECSFFFFLGFAEILDWIQGRSSRKNFLGFSFKACIWILFMWNVYFVFCYRSALQPHGKPFVGVRCLFASTTPLKQMLSDLGFRGD